MNPVSRWHLVQEIVFAASALRGEERSAYLSEHCPDSALRREVERLLEAGAAEVLTGNAGAGPGIAGKPAGEGLAPGTRLGHYQIGKKLGAGGMGWVYEATDEKLRRTVAIKVLPPGKIDEDLRRRFAREAQSASALNHPNIVTVYEVGREGDIDFIVMERVDGETLHQKIGGKGLDTRSTLRFAIQIADALATAHDAGIVHRDLKPGNVMATERGLVKVLDFGLAKHTPGIRAVDLDAPTLEPLSQLGQVVGTMAYMSPEQAAGRPVDTRSDIFSFGSVLFEMMTGRRAFRDSGMGTLAAIVQTEPPLAELPPSLPRGLDRILTKCLGKHPADRWQHISDVKLQLEDLLKDLDSPPAVEPAAAPARRRFGWLLVAAAALAGAFLSAVLLRLLSGPAPLTSSEPVLRMLTADTGLSSFPALSRDGKLLAFASDRSKEGSLDIWLQQIGGRELIRLTNDPADESDPSFSPDGTRIAFRSEKDGGGIYVMAALGGETPALVAPGGQNPRFSPDGKWIAYWTGREGGFYPGSSHLFLVEPGGGPPRPVHPEIPAALFPIWSPRGNELLVLSQVGGVLDWFIVPVDPNSPPRKTGALAQLKKQGLSELQRGLNIRQAPLDWTDQGGERVLFAAALGDATNLWEIELDADGAVRGPARRITRGPGRQVLAARAATGEVERTAFADEELNYDIWAMAVDADAGVPRGEPRRLTDEHSPEWAPSISSDGRKLAYISRRGGNWLLRTRDLDTGKESTVISSPTRILNGRLAGDGSRVLYSNTEYSLFSVPRSGGAVEKLCDGCGTVMGVSYDGTKAIYEPRVNEDLLVFDAAGGKSGKLALRPKDDVILSAGQFSRDGKWVAFHSLHNPDAAAQVWVAPVLGDGPTPQSEWIAITDGKARDREPSWAPGGGLLYFLSERDGFRCIWAQRLDARTKRPSGAAFAVRHFHTARQRLGSVGYLTGLSVGGDQMVFALGGLTGNIWLAENRRSK